MKSLYCTMLITMYDVELILKYSIENKGVKRGVLFGRPMFTRESKLAPQHCQSALTPQSYLTTLM